MIETVIKFVSKPMLALLPMLLLCGNAKAAKWNNDTDGRLPQSSRRVVMMGNSITEYWQWHEVNNHKEFFTENGALDRGIAAEITSSMLNRFQNDVINMHPLVCVIAGGVNDLNANVSVDEVYANNVKMAEMAVKAGIRPIMATINPSGWGKSTVDKYRQYNTKIKKWCADNGYSFCNYFDALKMSDTDYNEMKPEYRGRVDNSDHLHPSRAGYLVMEGVLIPLIEMNVWKNGNYEAEHAVKAGSSVADVTETGASNNSAVNICGSTDSLHLGYVTQKAASYDFTVTYKADNDFGLRIIVNKQAFIIKCGNTGGKFSAITVPLELNKGYNTISVTTENAKVMVDKFGIKDNYQYLADAYKIGEMFPFYSILGDSFSTFKGYLDTGGVNDDGTWYPNDDIQKVEQTWWWKFQDLVGSSLKQNNSISGSCVSYIGLNHSGTVRTPSFVNRVTKMKKGADLIIIEGGTNDKNTANMLGSYKWDGFTDDDPDYKYFRPALAYVISTLRVQHPDAVLVFMMNDALPNEMKTSIRTIMEHYGMPTFEMRDIPKYQGGGASGVHPTENGMTMIAEQFAQFLIDYIKNIGTTDMEAEDAEFIGSPEIKKDPQGSGAKTVGNIGNGNWLKFNVTQKTSGMYNLKVSCMAKDDKNVTIKVNDDEAMTVLAKGNGIGDKVRNGVDTLIVNVNLSAGENTILIGSENEDCPFIDKITIRHGFVPTGIKEIIADGNKTGYTHDIAANDEAYNLAEQRIRPGYKGLVIRNKRKFIVK